MNPLRWISTVLGILSVGVLVFFLPSLGGGPRDPGSSRVDRVAGEEFERPHSAPGLAPPYAPHGTAPLEDGGARASGPDDAAGDGGERGDRREDERERDGVRPQPLPLGTAIPMTRGTWPNVRVDSALFAPEETQIAIDPGDPNRIVAVAQGDGCYAFFSSDAGLTWTEEEINDPYDLGDPTLAVDGAGHTYYAYIGTFSHAGIFVARSTDSGETWAPGVPVIEHSTGRPFEDKQNAITDRTGGPWDGSLYLGWTQFDRYGSSNAADSTRILFSYSRNHGATFAPPVRVSDEGGNCVDEDDTVEGAVPAVGPDGVVHMAWAGPRGLEYDRSTDGGVTWGDDVVLGPIPGGWDFAVPGIYRCNGLPQTVADFTDGPYSGRVYVLWSDQRHGDTDVFLMHSDDGVLWSAPRRVNGDPIGNGRHQFFPWMDLDPLTGHLHVVFYDRRDTSGNATEVWIASSADGGATFSEQVVSQSPFTPNASTFFGDYIGISAYGGRVRPFWMRLDGNLMSVWTALVDLDTTSAPEAEPSPSSSVTSSLRLAAFPNPATHEARIFAWSASPDLPLPAGGVQIFSADGRLVRALPGREGGSSPALSSARGADAGRSEHSAGAAAPFATWDLRDGGGRPVPSGSYWVKAAQGGSARIVVTR